MMMTGKHFFRAGRKVELAGIFFDWLWNKDLARAIKKLGEALVFFSRTRVCLKDWSSNAFEDENQMSQRNAIGSIHSVETILGREMVNCTLKSQVRRWISLSQVIDLPRAAAVLATWMRGNNNPDDPRFIPVSKVVAQRNLENRVQAVLDSRLEKVKSLSQSRRGSPAKPIRDGPGAKDTTLQGQNPGSGNNNNNNKNSSNNNNKY